MLLRLYLCFPLLLMARSFEVVNFVFTSSRQAGPADQVVAAVTSPVFGLADLETLVQKLLLSVPALAPPPSQVPVELETMLKRLLSLALAPVPASPSRSAITAMRTGWRHLVQPGTPTPVPRTSSISDRRDWTTMVCVFCGRPGHGVSRCPYIWMTLSLTICRDGRRKRCMDNMWWFCQGQPQSVSSRKTTTDPGWGVSRPDQKYTLTPRPWWWWMVHCHLREDATMDLTHNGSSRQPVDSWWTNISAIEPGAGWSPCVSAG